MIWMDNRVLGKVMIEILFDKNETVRNVNGEKVEDGSVITGLWSSRRKYLDNEIVFQSSL